MSCIQEHSATTVRTDFGKLNYFSVGRDIGGCAPKSRHVDVFEAHCPVVLKDQIADIGFAVAEDTRKVFFRDREDASFGTAGLPVVEDAKLEAVNVFLDDGVR